MDCGRPAHRSPLIPEPARSVKFLLSLPPVVRSAAELLLSDHRETTLPQMLLAERSVDPVTEHSPVSSLSSRLFARSASTRPTRRRCIGAVAQARAPGRPLQRPTSARVVAASSPHDPCRDGAGHHDTLADDGVSLFNRAVGRMLRRAEVREEQAVLRDAHAINEGLLVRQILLSRSALSGVKERTVRRQWRE